MKFLNDLVAGHQIGSLRPQFRRSNLHLSNDERFSELSNFSVQSTCGGSIPCDNALQVVKDLVTVAFVRLFPHIGKVISKEHSQLIQSEHYQTHQVQCHLHFRVSHEKEMREGTEFKYRSCSIERKNGTIVPAKSWLRGSHHL